VAAAVAVAGGRLAALRAQLGLEDRCLPAAGKVLERVGVADQLLELGAVGRRQLADRRDPGYRRYAPRECAHPSRKAHSRRENAAAVMPSPRSLARA